MSIAGLPGSLVVSDLHDGGFFAVDVNVEFSAPSFYHVDALVQVDFTIGGNNYIVSEG